MLMLKRLRSVPLMGGVQGPSVSRSPGAAPQKKAGRPMGPSTPRCTDPWRRLWFFCFFFCCGLGFVICCLFRVFVSGVGLLSGFLSPSSPDLCVVFLSVSLLSSCVWLVSSTPCFLFLFLRCWGNPNLFGLGFPLCSLRPAHALRPRPVLRVPHVHLGVAPAPVFFFFPFFPSPSLAFLVLVFLGLPRWCSSLFCGCRFSWWVFLWRLG